MNTEKSYTYPIKIFRVESRSTGQVYFLAIGSADTDMVTNGLLLLASVNNKELHLYGADAEEYPLGPFLGAKRRADRENAKQGRSDLKPVALDLSQLSLHPHVLEYAFHDAVADGFADAIEVVEVQAFLGEGGVVIDGR